MMKVLFKVGALANSEAAHVAQRSRTALPVSSHRTGCRLARAQTLAIRDHRTDRDYLEAEPARTLFGC